MKNSDVGGTWIKESIQIYDKYTVVIDEEHGVYRVLRYGEPWRDFAGDKLLYLMACKILELEEKLKM